MSKYTTEVRFICEQKAGLNESADGASVEEIIELARPKIFDFNYPIFDASYKEVIETKILKHFYTREIGLETVGLWKLKLNTVMNEIMPLYNQFYESALLSFNPFYDVDYTRSHTGTETTDDTISQTETKSGTKRDAGTRTVNNTNVVDGTTVDKFSDTPQGSVTLQDVANNAYLTNLRKIDEDKTTTDNGGESHDITITDNGSTTTTASNGRDFAKAFTEQIRGKMGTESYSKMLQEFRETFLNIDMMVVEDDKMKNLFMKLW